MASRFGSLVPIFLVLVVLFLLAPDYAAGLDVTFKLQKNVGIGRGVRIAGNTTNLGNWDAASAAQMEVDTATGQDWSVTVVLSLEVGERVLYKPVITDYGSGDNPTWFDAYNLVFEVPDADALVVPIIWPDSSLFLIKEVIN